MKDTFQMTAQELREHFKKLRQEYDRDPQSHLKALNRSVDIVNYYSDPDPAIIDMDHVRATKENIYNFAQYQTTSINERIKGLKHYETLFTHVLTELKAGNRITGTFHINDREKQRYHLKEINYYLYHIRYLIEFLSRKKYSKPKPLKGFQTNYSDAKIEALYNQMSGQYFQATLQDWKAVFTTGELPPGHSIVWLKSNVLLAFFISEAIHPFNNEPWSRSEMIFGKNNLQQSNFNNPYPRGAEKLKSIIQTI